MPLLRGSVSFSRFLVQSDKPWKAADARRVLGRGLRAKAFEPIDRRSEEDRSAGFVEVENPESVEFSVGALFFGEHALFAWRVDQLRLPSALVKAELGRWESQFQQQQQRPPSRKERSEGKAQVRQFLRQRATPSTKVHDVSWNLKTGQLQIWAGSRKAVEEVQAVVESVFSLRLVPRVPGSMLGAEVSEDSLVPTAQLLGVEEKELGHGQA